MNLSDLREKRNKLMADASVAKQEDFTPESRAKFDAMIADVDVLAADIARLERTAKFEDEQRSKPEFRPAPAVNEDRSVAEKRAFVEYLRTGALPEQRDLLTTNSNGAALIPQAYAPEIVQARKDYGGIVNLVKTWETESGAPMKTSLVNDTANLMAVVPEGTAGTVVDPAATSILISTDELMGVTKVSLQELQDASFDVSNFLQNVFGARYFRTLGNYITNGSSSGNIQSLVSGYSSNFVQTAATGTIAYADLVKAYGLLDPAYMGNAAWSMNTKTRANLMGVTDSFGRPLYIPAPNAGAFDTLLGRPVVINTFLSDVATGNTALQFGDFKEGYKLRVVKPGLSVVRLNERFMDTLEIGFVAYARVGGAVTDAGTHPVVNISIK